VPRHRPDLVDLDDPRADPAHVPAAQGQRQVAHPRELAGIALVEPQRAADLRVDVGRNVRRDGREVRRQAQREVVGALGRRGIGRGLEPVRAREDRPPPERVRREVGEAPGARRGLRAVEEERRRAADLSDERPRPDEAGEGPAPLRGTGRSGLRGALHPRRILPAV
jgi:hypothetical protein